jgi:hypothetical protein
VGGALGIDHRLGSGDKANLFDPATDKPYRNPTFYDIPDGVRTSDHGRAARHASSCCCAGAIPR